MFLVRGIVMNKETYYQRHKQERLEYSRRHRERQRERLRAWRQEHQRELLEYKQLLLAHKDKAELILYLVKLPFFDWNEAASQVLQVIDEVGPKKLRVALLSLFMTAKIKAETE